MQIPTYKENTKMSCSNIILPSVHCLFFFKFIFQKVFNQGKVMCCDLRSVGDMTIYPRLKCSSSSPQILCIRPRLCSLHHCKALPSIHKYDEQQQLDDEVHLPSTLPSLEPFNASNSSIASKMQTRKIRWYVDTLKGEFELNYAYIMQTWALN